MDALWRMTLLATTLLVAGCASVFAPNTISLSETRLQELIGSTSADARCRPWQHIVGLVDLGARRKLRRDGLQVERKGRFVRRAWRHAYDGQCLLPTLPP